MILMLLSQWEMNSLLLIDRPLTTAVLENHLLTAPPRPRWRVIGCYWREMGCTFVCLYLLMLVNASDLLSRILETWLLNWGSHKNRSAPPWVYSFFLVASVWPEMRLLHKSLSHFCFQRFLDSYQGRECEIIFQRADWSPYLTAASN